MNGIVAVFTEDKLLFQKIYLALKPDFSVVPIDKGVRTFDGFALVLWDLDSAELPDSLGDGAITMGYGACDLVRPFATDAILEILKSRKNAAAQLVLGERSVYLREKEIKLTELEFSLLSRLARDGGEYVSRERLLEDVWGEGFDGSVLNVYIHYLREKLEVSGEKIIISSRKNGYKIDEKYLSGGRECLE